MLIHIQREKNLISFKTMKYVTKNNPDNAI